MKRIAVLLTLLVFLSSMAAVSPAQAASALKLTANNGAAPSDPLLDYSSFVKIKFEKYNDIIDKFFRTVKRQYFERYDEYREMMDIIRNDGSYYVYRA